MNLTRPQNMQFVDWADQVAQDFSQYGVIPKVHSESEWQNWGIELTQLPQISRQNPPNPFAFPSWMSWAEFFCEAII